MAAYNDLSRQAAENSDQGTKELFDQLIRDEESHFDQFDTQLDNIKRFGPSYLALQAMGGSSEGPGGQ